MNLNLKYQIGQEKLLKFHVRVDFQGDDFVDPDGWDEEEMQNFRSQYDKEYKKKKKGRGEKEKLRPPSNKCPRPCTKAWPLASYHGTRFIQI